VFAALRIAGSERLIHHPATIRLPVTDLRIQGTISAEPNSHFVV